MADFPRSDSPLERSAETGVVGRFVEAGLHVASVEDMRALAETMEARINPFGFEISGNGYGFEAVDVVLRSDRGLRRVFAHETFDDAEQAGAEAVLREAGLDFFPELARGEHFTFRELPPVTMPLASHNVTRPSSRTIGKNLLAPVLQTLFGSAGVVPSQATLENLVHVEQIERVETRDQFRLGAYFIPPYQFEPVGQEAFLPTALERVAGYGELVVAHVAESLQAAA